MKLTRRFASIQSLLSSLTRSTFLSTKAARPTSTRLFRFRGLSISLVVATLFVALTLSASIFERGRRVAAFAESISTFAATDCTTPKTEWDLSQTACAVATGTTGQRRIAWVTPDGTVADLSNPFSGTGSDTYTFLTSGPFAQYGTWTVRTIDASGSGFAVASFLVRNEAVDNVDLVVSKFGPDKAIAGGAVPYRIEILNRGPNVADGVVLTESVPNNSTFASEAQDSGPSAICDNPNGGETGTSTCTIPSLAPNETAIFTFVYNVNAGTPVGTLIVNNASVSSSTNELFQNNNTARFQVEVAPGTASPACTINCPASISVDNNASDPNPCVKAVTYTTPTASGGCADPDTGQIPAVVCSPPSGSDFPIGTSSVVCSTGTTTCSFTISVNETRAPVQPALNCPANITVSESSPGSGTAIVNYPAPSATGNCVVVVCNPQSGALFALGTTPVNCTGTDSANNTASCSFSVTVNAFSCGLDCPVDRTVNESSPGSGSATVTYSTPATVGSCPSLTIACSPTSGSSFPVGTTQVNCTGTDSSSNVIATCSFNIRVNSSSTCTITCPANVTASESPSGSGSTTVTYSTPTSTGTCAAAPASCSPPSGSSFPVGTTTVTCTRSDPAGNVSTCSFAVTVTGGTPCTITCPSNITQSSGGCGTAVTYPSPTTSGSCGDPNNPDDPNPWSCNPPSGSFFPVGTSTVVCSTDVGVSCSFTVTIAGIDTTPPVIISCAPPTFASADGCQAVLPNVTSGVDASDNCTPAGLLTVTQSPAPGTIIGTGTTTIVVTVKDASNNSATCTTTFTVTEPNPPTISCPANISVTAAIGQPSAVVTFSPTVTDDCPGASFVCVPPSGSAFQLGVTTVNCTATDPSGNQATCTFKVAVSGTLLATADSFVRDGADNTNEGGNNLLRIQSSGHNRVLARFNVSGISTSGLQSASVVLNITENSDNWGSSGRLVDAHRLLTDWTEGNGHTVGNQPNFRGTGEGVTWNCAKDSNISNQNDDCASQWDGGTIAAATATSVLHTNNQLGDVSWNVTADVLAGANNGWVIKKQTEGQNGQVRYYSKEGAVAAGNQNLGPRLVLVFQP